jgi:hypothetical protein
MKAERQKRGRKKGDRGPLLFLLAAGPQQAHVPEALHQRALMRARHPGLLEQAVRELEVRMIREELARTSGQRYAAAKQTRHRLQQADRAPARRR